MSFLIQLFVIDGTVNLGAHNENERLSRKGCKTYYERPFHEKDE